MYFSRIVIILGTASIAAASPALVKRVDISGAPACAQTCLTANQGSSTCDPNATDPSCFCADQTFYNAVANCVASTCPSSDIIATLNWYSQTCPS